MKNILTTIIAMLMAGSTALAQSATGYEWWFDSDQESAQSGALSGAELTLSPDLSGLPHGVHYFNLRLNDANGVWGAPYRKMFITVDNTVGAVGYEYWIDDNHAAKTDGTINGGSLSFPIDLTGYTPGAHYFNCRLYTNSGGWGAPYRKMVFTTGSLVDATAFEYWIDNDYEHRTSGAYTDGGSVYAVSLEGVKKGLHRFNYRVQNGIGTWGSIYSQYFFYSSSAAPFTAYEYWLDKDYDNKVSATPATNPATFNVDLSNFDKSGDVHYFNLRARDDDGDWGSIYRKLLLFYKNNERTPIIGYRHMLNNEDLGHVTVPRDTSATLTFTVDLPQGVGLDIATAKIDFDGDVLSVAANDSINYTIQIESELGWAPPVGYDFEIGNDFSTTAEAMDIPSFIKFAAPGAAEFKAVKFVTDGRELFFRADRRATLDIYRSGEKVTTVTPDELTATKALTLETGTYYGVIYNVADGNGDITFHLMDTDNQLLMPQISFDKRYNDRGFISMTCSHPDAEIHYTIDDTAISTESTLYEGEVELTRNAVVRAMAVVPGTDINPSDVAMLSVDSFTVGDPEIRFDEQNLYVVIIPDAMEGVRTYYTLDDTEPTELDELRYDGNPITLSDDCKIRARSFKDGYNPSKIVEWEYKHATYTTLPPLISVKGTKVTMTGQTSDSRIFYGIDNNDPSTFTLYEGEFEISGNCTIYAQARSAGRYDSAVVSVEINGMKLPTPQITYVDNKLSITCANSDAIIYYTTADTSPNRSSTLYEGTFEFDRNGVIKAIAFDPTGYLEPSNIAVYTITDKTVTRPTISFESLKVVITPDSREGVKTYYTIDGGEPTEASAEYTEPFSLTEDSTVKARSFKDGYNPSEITEFLFVRADYQVTSPAISYDGRYATITCPDSEAEIHYTLDGANPADGNLYSEAFDVLNVGVVKAYATKTDSFNSDVTEYTVNVYTDEEHAATAKAGVLADGFGWYKELPQEVENYRFEGPLGEADLRFIRHMEKLRHIDMQNAEVTTFPDSIFAGSNFVSVVMPESMESYGDSIFAGSPLLSAIALTGSATADEKLTAGIDNPNMLLFLLGDDTAIEGNPARNIVNGNHAESLTLSDGYPFYAPYEFTADVATYEREFSKVTEIDGCSGWETITVPFDVESVTDSRGEAMPFAADNGSRRFWLFRPIGTGWERTADIEAYEPYLIAMPNHPWYEDEYIITGRVTFSAKNALIAATPEVTGVPYKNGFDMVANYMPKAADSDVYVINDEAIESHLPGSVFAASLRDARPFEGYLTGISSARYLPVFDSSEVEMLMGDTGMKIWVENNEICIRSGIDARVRVYDTMGRLMATADAKAGETARVTGLPKGIYIVGSLKLTL